MLNKITINKTEDKIIEKIKIEKDFQYFYNKINELKPIIEKLIHFEPDDNFIKKIKKGYDDLLEFINKDKKIRIALLGLYSSGKNTILNNLIGENILPVSSDECTRRGIIIRYHNKNIPELYKTKFIPKSDYYYFEDSINPLGSGFKEVYNKLEELNKINDKFEESFYILKIKINFYDEYNIDNELKEKIEFIDFPGLHSENNFYEDKIFTLLMQFTHGFIFIIKNDLIKEKSNVEALIEIINRIDSKKLDLIFF